MTTISKNANATNTSFGSVLTGAMAGQVLTAGGHGSSYTTAWTGGSSSITNGDILTVKNNPPSLEVKGTVIINGFDLEERLKTIERVLLIPTRDATMEAKYPSLKKKFDEYINTLEKYRTFERVKGNEDGTT